MRCPSLHVRFDVIKEAFVESGGDGGSSRKSSWKMIIAKLKLCFQCVQYILTWGNTSLKTNITAIDNNNNAHDKTTNGDRNLAIVGEMCYTFIKKKKDWIKRITSNGSVHVLSSVQNVNNMKPWIGPRTTTSINAM